MRIIGLDLDNTIINYTGVFHRYAVAQGLMDASVSPAKDDVRDHLRAAGREDEWTALQGFVYGPGLVGAPPFEGVIPFMRQARSRGWRVVIISHKTRKPYAGPDYDLQAYAREWLAQSGVLEPGPGGLTEQDLFLEATKQAKLSRIQSAGCTVFVDDLPEFLGDPDFPGGIRRVLFDPDAKSTPDPRWTTLRTWNRAADALLA